MALFLNPYFKENEFGRFSKTETYLFFAGLFNAFLYDFYLFLILVLISTALLICVENTFWNINDGDGNFVEVFKKSFSLYVKSGKREMTERDIEIFKNEQGELEISTRPGDSDYTKFYKFIVDHYLRKFHYIYFHLTHLITALSSPTKYSETGRKKDFMVSKVDAEILETKGMSRMMGPEFC